MEERGLGGGRELDGLHWVLDEVRELVSRQDPGGLAPAGPEIDYSALGLGRIRPAPQGTRACRMQVRPIDPWKVPVSAIL